MKTVIDFTVFIVGILILVLILFAANPHSEIVKMDFKEVQPPSTQGT